MYDSTLDEARAVSSGPLFDFFNRQEHNARTDNRPAGDFNVENVL
jgi:hypothetical protein